ncbi:MAG: hypothetical protein HY321_21895 [Armatimonadetes bacterium]|nr:hypothetical protein [Armatimonadota bacterium]
MLNNEHSRARERVRELAREVAAVAASDENRLRGQRWRDVNSLRKPDRSPIWSCVVSPDIRPMAPVSSDPFDLAVERQLIGWLRHWALGDDFVMPDHMEVPMVVRVEGEHVWGLPIVHESPPDVPGAARSRGAWRYEPPIKEESDIDRIRLPRYQYDRAATQRNQGRTHDIVGDILPVFLSCGNGYHLHGLYGAWLHGWAMGLRGMEQLLIDMMDRPQWVHRLMQTLMRGYLDAYDQFEEAQALALNHTTGKLFCDDLPQPDYDPKRLRLKDLWGRSESQEFQGVGPAQYEEFLLQYQKPILERFGLVFYGCCEDLTRKVPHLLTLRNLRRFVASAWTDLGTVVDAVGDRYAIEWRQLATDFVFKPMPALREHLERGLQRARGTYIMIVLREVATLEGRNERPREWVRIARECAEKHA